MGVTVEVDRVIWHCFRCEERGARRHQPSVRPVPTIAAAPEKHLTLAAHWRAAYRELQPISDSPVSDYLKAHCCELPQAHVRYALALRHPSGYIGPAMVAL